MSRGVMSEAISANQHPPFVSVIVPTRGDTPRCLRFVRRLAGADRVEVLVACGEWPSRQRNLAVARARGTYLYFLDDDSAVQRDAVERIVGFFSEHPNAAGLGGPSLPPRNSWWQILLGELFAHPLATFAVRHRYSRSGTPGPSADSGLILANLVIRRDVFVEVGGFDERLYPNEENELIERVQAAGQVFHRDPAFSVVRPHRGSCGALARQIWGYGRGRGEQTRHRPSWRSWQQSLKGLALGAWAAAGWAVPMLGWLWVAYAVALAAVAAQRAVARGRPSFLALAPLLLLVHSSYGVGVATGLLAAGRPARTGPIEVVRGDV